MKFIQILLLICISQSHFAQALIGNLIENPSFELFSSQSGAFDAAKSWESLDSSKLAYYYLSGAPPYQNAPYSSFGFQFPRTGQSFVGAGFYGIYRGYPRNRLTSVLVPNKVYCVRYYIVNTNNNPYAIDSFGAWAADSTADTIKYCNAPLSYVTPQIQTASGTFITDTLNWIAISGTFAATGVEKYLVLGNFRSQASTNTVLINPTNSMVITSDLYIDDVSCIELELPAYAGQDISIIPGDSTYLGRVSDIELDASCQWYRLPNDTIPLDTAAGIWVKPNIKTTYVLRQQLWCSGVKWDTVTIHVNTVGLYEPEVVTRSINIYPNPANKQLKVSWSGNKDNVGPNDISAYNSLGQLVKVPVTDVRGGEMTFDTSGLSPGVYFIRVGEALITKKFVVQH
jgi:hypothetical protein